MIATKKNAPGHMAGGIAFGSAPEREGYCAACGAGRVQAAVTMRHSRRSR